MADVTISGLPAVTTVAPSVDVLPIVSNSGVDTVKATPNQIVQAVLPAPGPIGATTPDSGKFTTVQSTVATGTAPFTVASTTNVANLNASSLSGATFAAPGPIGSTTPSTAAFTTVTTSAGTNTIAPINLTSGTNLTSATAGAVEYDGRVVYATPTAGCRGVVAAEQFITLTSTYTLTSQTAAQKLFNSSTNGAVTLPVGTFAFECEFNLSAMSATSGSFGFALGGTAAFTQYWTAIANKAALATTTNVQSTFNTAANVALATANTTTTGYARITGQLVVTVAGTVIPQVSLGQLAAAIVGLGSFFRIRPLGSSTVTTVGNWS